MVVVGPGDSSDLIKVVYRAGPAAPSGIDSADESAAVVGYRTIQSQFLAGFAPRIDFSHLPLDESGPGAGAATAAGGWFQLEVAAGKWL